MTEQELKEAGWEIIDANTIRTTSNWWRTVPGGVEQLDAGPLQAAMIKLWQDCIPKESEADRISRITRGMCG